MEMWLTHRMIFGDLIEWLGAGSNGSLSQV